MLFSASYMMDDGWCRKWKKSILFSFLISFLSCVSSFRLVFLFLVTTIFHPWSDQIWNMAKTSPYISLITYSSVASKETTSLPPLPDHFLIFAPFVLFFQLFINHKLKSVSHLPWKFLIFRFLNTFIDDLFAFGKYSTYVRYAPWSWLFIFSNILPQQSEWLLCNNQPRLWESRNCARNRQAN